MCSPLNTRPIRCGHGCVGSSAATEGTWRGREPVPVLPLISSVVLGKDVTSLSPFSCLGVSCFCPACLPELLGGLREVGHSFPSTPLGLPQVQGPGQQRVRQTIAVPSDITAPSGQQEVNKSFGNNERLLSSYRVAGAVRRSTFQTSPCSVPARRAVRKLHVCTFHRRGD